MTEDHPAREPILFAIIGLAASACHFLVAVLLIEMFGVPVWIANIIAFFSAFPISLAGHAKLTFKANKYGREQAITKQATTRFFLTASLGGCVNQLGVVVFAELLGAPHRWVIGGMIVCVAALTFLLSKFWAFKGRSQDVG